MMISEVTLQNMKDYMRVDYEDDDPLIHSMMLASKSFIMNYTGLTEETINTKPDLTIAYLVLVNELYTQRQLSVDKDKVNVVVTTILAMYCINLL